MSALDADTVSFVHARPRLVVIARRVHNDAVRDVRRVRGKRSVRFFRLAGYAALPEPVEFDDALPRGLRA